MRNNNRQAVRRLSVRSMKQNKMRNLFAVVSIALTCMLFTVVASMAIGMMQVTQEQTMREVGTKCHAGLKDVTEEQMNRIVSDDRVKDYSWNILVASVDNLIQRSGELRVPQGEKELDNSFIQLEEGGLPQKPDDLVVDTLVMEELGLPCQVGQQVELTFSFLGGQISKIFTVCGWYEGDQIGHASQLYVSQAYWEELKGDHTDQDFLDWKKARVDNSQGAGLYQVGLFFSSASDIEEQVRAVIADAGYEPETQIEYGINWAYMQNRAESLDAASILVLASAVIVVLVTGYLMIYNIFQISITQEIRFYGLLKTVGTTKRQIRRLIGRQALLLSLAGIPLGLILGLVIGKLLFPFAMSFTNTQGVKAELQFDPVILIFGAVFAMVTVMLGCRKPGKMAGAVSPVEAVRYSEGTVKRRGEKKSSTGARIHRMALSNLGRNKKKTVSVILSLSLSITLLCVVMTGVESFRLDSYLESRLVGDVSVGSVRYTNLSSTVPDTVLDEGMVEYLDDQPGIESSARMYTSTYPRVLNLDDQAAARYEGWRDQGLLRAGDDWSDYALEQALDQREVQTDAYGYDEELLEKLTVLEGQLDVEKFQEGGYVLLTSVIGDHTDGCLLYEPGDTVTIGTVGADSVPEEITDENGNILDVVWHDREEQEYEVMAIVEIPSSLDLHSYSVNGVGMVLPESEFTESYPADGEYVGGEDYGYCFAKTYTLKDGYEDAFVRAAESYVNNENPNMGYVDRRTLEQEFSGMVTVIRTIGIGLSAVIALIGVLNFINSMMTGIIARKREFAVLSSIGMTGGQIRRLLLEEGLYYVAISGGIGILLGSVAAWGVLSALNQVILFFRYQYDGTAFLIMLPIFAVIALLIPGAAYARMSRESVVERLRDGEC